MKNVLRIPSHALFFKRFSFNGIKIILVLTRNSDSLSYSVLRMLEQAFIIGRGGDDVGTRQGSTPGHIKGGSYGVDSIEVYFFKMW